MEPCWACGFLFSPPDARQYSEIAIRWELGLGGPRKTLGDIGPINKVPFKRAIK